MKESMLLKTLSCHREQRINEGTKVDRKETILEQKESHIPPNVLCEIYKCQKYKNSAPQEKFALVKGKKNTLQLFEGRSFQNKCKSKNTCFQRDCKDKHHTSLLESFKKLNEQEVKKNKRKWR